MRAPHDASRFSRRRPAADDGGARLQGFLAAALLTIAFLARHAGATPIAGGIVLAGVILWTRSRVMRW